MNNPVQIHSAHNPPVISYSTCGQGKSRERGFGCRALVLLPLRNGTNEKLEGKLRLSEDAG